MGADGVLVYIALGVRRDHLMHGQMQLHPLRDEVRTRGQR